MYCNHKQLMISHSNIHTIAPIHCKPQTSSAPVNCKWLAVQPTSSQTRRQLRNVNDPAHKVSLTGPGFRLHGHAAAAEVWCKAGVVRSTLISPDDLVWVRPDCCPHALSDVSVCYTGDDPPVKKIRTNSMSEARPAAASLSVSARLEKELERTLREFVRMRTVSSDPSLREDCFRGAKYLAHLLESLGNSFAPS